MEPERTRASIAIAVAWSGLAVVFGAYALRNAAAGPLLLALFSIWCLRLAWASAWSDGEPSDDAE